SPRLVESVTNLDVEIAIVNVCTRVTLDRDLGAGQLEIDPNLVEVALLMVEVRDVDDHPAAHDPRAQILKPKHLGLDPLLDFRRWREVVKSDLQGEFHGDPSLSSVAQVGNLVVPRRSPRLVEPSRTRCRFQLPVSTRKPR